MMRGGGINPVAANVQYKSTEYTSDNQKKVFITGNSKLLWFGERLIPCNSSWSSRRRRWWWRIGPCWSVFSNCARFYCHLAAVSWPVMPQSRHLNITQTEDDDVDVQVEEILLCQETRGCITRWQQVLRDHEHSSWSESERWDLILQF